MSNYEKKAGHPVPGIILAILGIIIALLLTLLTGVIAGGTALVLGVIALALGISARRQGGRGIGAIIAGALAIILAVMMTVGSVGTFRAVQKEAARYADEAPLVVRSLNQPYFGLLGLILNIPQDEGSAQELIDQFNLVNEKIKAVPAE